MVTVSKPVPSCLGITVKHPTGHARPYGRHLLTFAPLLAALNCLPALAIEYSAGPIEALVVDAETGTPLEGVNVVAGWESKGGLEGGNVLGWVKVLETVTDKSGQFRFPAWGPVTWTNRGVVRSGSPLLMFFKSGYDRLLLTQRKRSPTEAAPPHMESDWSNQTIRLQRFRGTEEEYAQRIGYFDIIIDSLLSTDECNWRYMPRFLLSLENQNKQFIARKLVHGVRSIDYLSNSYSGGCGNLKAHVLEYGR